MYYRDGHLIPFVKSVKDLEVTLHPTLQFSLHFSAIVDKERARALRKCFISETLTSLVRIFVACVISLVEHASIWWTCHVTAKKVSLNRYRDALPSAFPASLRFLTKIVSSNRVWTAMNSNDFVQFASMFNKILFGLVEIDANSVYFLHRSISTRTQVSSTSDNVYRTDASLFLQTGLLTNGTPPFSVITTAALSPLSVL